MMMITILPLDLLRYDNHGDDDGDDDDDDYNLTSRSSKEMGEMTAGPADCWSVDDRSHFVKVVHQQPG